MKISEILDEAISLEACEKAVDWALENPDATILDLIARKPAWAAWGATNIERITGSDLDACIAGTNDYGRGGIGRDRADLTPAQLDDCIAGTNADGRGGIGSYRADLTPAQRAACKRSAEEV